MDEFLTQLADILDVDQVKADDTLGDFEEWDSLSILSVIAMADANLKITLNAAEVKTATTAGDLFRLIQGKLGK